MEGDSLVFGWPLTNLATAPLLTASNHGRSGESTSETKYSEQKRKFEEGVSALDEEIEGCQTKWSHATQQLGKWREILRLITAADSNRGAKPEHMRWIDYFKQILNDDLLEAPSAFTSAEMTDEDACIAVSSQVSLLRTKCNSATKAKTRAEHKKQRKEQYWEKLQKNIEKKASQILEDPDSLEQKKKKLKRLVCIWLQQLT